MCTCTYKHIPALYPSLSLSLSLTHTQTTYHTHSFTPCRFPFELLPSSAYYIATYFCSKSLVYICDHDESTAMACIVELATWPMWIWWLTTLFRGSPRAVRLYHFWSDLETNLDVKLGVLQISKFVFMIFMTCHWIGCGYWWLARIYHMDDTTWTRQVEIELPLYNRFQSSDTIHYILCLLRGISALSTIGFYMSFPNNVGEHLFTITVIIVQVWLTSKITGTLIFYFGQKDLATEAHKERLEALHAYCETKMLTLDLRDKIFKHVEFQHKKKVENKVALSMVLPKSLAVKVAECKYKSVMEKCTARRQLFDGCHSQFISDLLLRMHVVYLMLGEEIAKKHDAARELVFVLYGAAEVLDGDKLKRVVRSDVPDVAPVLAPEAFFFGLPHPHNIRARLEGDVQLLIISREVRFCVYESYVHIRIWMRDLSSVMEPWLLEAL
jgi:hypothetical protein